MGRIFRPRAPAIVAIRNPPLIVASPGEEGDGSANAPTGTPQFPNLLNGYAFRPSRQVAGVDYRVGINTGVSLASPTTIAISGVNIDASGHVVEVDANNVSLNAIDFSLNGGWHLKQIAGRSNLLVTNSKFIYGANGHQHFFGQRTDDPGVTGVAFRYCEIDGGGVDVGAGAHIEHAGGSITMEYTYYYNIGVDGIQIDAVDTFIKLRWNLFKDAGVLGTGHPDLTQLERGSFVVTMDNNTLYQTAGATQGFATEWQTSGSSSRNTIVVTGGSVSPAFTIDKHQLTGNYETNDNYFAGTGQLYYTDSPNSGFPGDGNAFTIFSGNVDMDDGPTGNG